MTKINDMKVKTLEFQELAHPSLLHKVGGIHTHTAINELIITLNTMDHYPISMESSVPEKTTAIVT